MIRVSVVDLDETTLEPIAQIYVDCFSGGEKAENWTLETSKAYMEERRAEESIFWGAVDESGEWLGVSIGSALETSYILNDIETHPKKCFYSSLVAVKPGGQGKGIGRSIIAAQHNTLKKRGFARVLTRTRGNNFPMIGLLKSFGYVEQRRYTAELGGVVCERVLWLKTL